MWFYHLVVIGLISLELFYCQIGYLSPSSFWNIQWSTYSLDSSGHGALGATNAQSLSVTEVASVLGKEGKLVCYHRLVDRSAAD